MDIADLLPARSRSLFAPSERPWFAACWRARQLRQDTEFVAALRPPWRAALDAEIAASRGEQAVAHRARLALAHLDALEVLAAQPVASGSLDGAFSREQIAALESHARAAGLPRGLMLDLAHELLATPRLDSAPLAPHWTIDLPGWKSGRPRPAAARVPEAIVPVALVIPEEKEEENPRGLLCNLVLELVDGGRGELIPSPAMTAFWLDWKFAGALADVRIWLENDPLSAWPADKDLRWHLRPRDNAPWPVPDWVLGGDSAGGAFGLGCLKLLADAGRVGDPWRLQLAGVDFSEILILAGLDADGRLRTIGGDAEKVLGAMDRPNRSVRDPLRGIVSARAQRSTLQNAFPPLRLGDELDGIRFLHAERLDETLGDLKALAIRHTWAVTEYLKWLTDELGDIRPLGLQTIRPDPLPIAEAYVPMTTVASLGWERGQPDAFEEDAKGERMPFRELFRFLRDRHQAGKSTELGRLVLVLGEPGGGKTTAARQLVWLLASGTMLPTSLGFAPGTVPVWLRFRDLGHALPDGPAPLEAVLKLHTRFKPGAGNVESIEAGPALLERDRPLLWVFDGLDEVIDDTLRRTICDALLQLASARHRDYVLVTSRYFDASAEERRLEPAFCRFQLKPLEKDQRQDFIERYFAILDPGQATDRARDLAEKIESHIRNHPLDAPVAANPLMLSLICFIQADSRGEPLPRDWSQLYERFLREFVEHWRRLDDGGGRFRPEAVYRLLESLAWFLQCQTDRISAPRDDLADEVERVMGLPDFPPRWRRGLPADGERFLDLMREQCGLLAWQGRSAGRLGFLLLPMQEYLAARHAIGTNQAAELARRFCAETGESTARVEDGQHSHWRHVTALASRTGTGAFRRDLLAGLIAGELDQKDDLFLRRCVQEAGAEALDPLLRAIGDESLPRERREYLLTYLRQYEDYAGAPQAGALREAARGLAPFHVAVEILARAGEDVSHWPGGEHLFIHEKTRIAFIRVPGGEGIEPFACAKYALTNREWRRYAREHPEVDLPRYWDDGQFNLDQQPVVGVSWYEAQAYAKWSGLRLLGEKEWEHACRAGSVTEYCYGDDEARLGEYAWYGNNSGGTSHPVGLKMANAWGLCDLHGNVWEWCEDSLLSSGSIRGYRGGCWGNPAWRCRSACRYRSHPDDRHDVLGFRLALSPVRRPEAG